MKKILLVTVLAMALVFAFAGSAMARPNGNIYIQWDATGANAAMPTPHAGYTTATEKCAVCHSVHYAATSGVTWPDTAGAGANAWTAGTEETQMLLRSSVANACNYCHITTSIGGVQLYGGDATNYTTESNFAHNTHAPCSGCHAVHGANTFQGPNTSKILRVLTASRPIQPEVISGALGNPLITPVYASEAAAVADTPALGKYYQQIAFCTQCHAEYTDASEATITGGPGYYDGAGYIPGTEYKGHPMKAAEVGGFTAAGDTISVQAAWVDAGTCRSCHDAGGTDLAPGVTTNSFPHYTAGYNVFSYTGAYEGVQDAADLTKDYATDGNCLKCHVNAAQDAGINITF